MPELLSVAAAQERILSFFQPVDTEMVAVEQCNGRVLAGDICAPGDLPIFDNSSMDGFAVLSADIHSAGPAQPVTLAIVADIPAGSSADITILPGQAARIMTGAPLPHGADTVVPVEETSFSPALAAGLLAAPDPGVVAIYQSAPAGENIRRSGTDVRKGQVLLRKGHKLYAQDIGMLASSGYAAVEVYRRPRVALFSSGNELVPPGQSLGPGQIYDSNQFVLAALLEQEGAQVIRLGTAEDDPAHITALLGQAVIAQVDLIVTSAGVSVGAFDYVRQVIESRGSLDFWKVNMRPGKPLAFGTFSNIPLIALPGNPVSAFVGCLVFVLPVLNRLAGRSQLLPRREKALLAEAITSDGRESYLRAFVQEVNGQRVARLTGHQGSGNIYSLVQANALLIVPSGVKSLPSEAIVEIWYLNRD